MLTASPLTKSPRPKRELRIRLWRSGGLIAMFIFTMIVGNAFIPKDQAVSWDMLGHDFLVFYYGGTCARTGHSEQLFDLSATRAFEFKTGQAANLSLGPSFGPWWNPPFAAWMFAPLSALPYLTALHVWWLIGAVSLAISIFLMCRMLSGGWKSQLLVPLLVVTAMPCFQAFCHGQNTLVSLLLLTTTVTLWRGGQSLLAGVVCGLLFYKPQLGVVVAAVLCLTQGRRAMLGVALTGTALVLVNMFTMPGTIHEFAYHMPLNMRWMLEENHYRWARHVTFKAFWRLAIQGGQLGPTAPSVLWLWIACELALLAGLAAAAWKTVRGGLTPSKRDRLIAATIVAMPLLMPFYFDYDLLLISVGLVVYAADRQREWSAGPAANWEDRWLLRIFAALYLLLEFMAVLSRSRIHPVVPLLAAAATLLIRRALRPHPAAAAQERPSAQPTTISLAA